MKKSLTNFNPKETPKKRSNSMSSISINEFSQFSQQLSLLTEELSMLKKEKEALIEYNSQLTKKIEECKNHNQYLSSNHDKLHNESKNINKSLQRFEQTRVKNSKTCKESQDNINKLEQTIEDLYRLKEDLLKRHRKESNNVTKLQEVVMKMRNELTLQEKDRERLRNDVNCSNKQIQQLEEKVERLENSNMSFMKKIKVSIIRN
ncbi:hypothetical protein SteCoe_13336 [Stentor coeruleus]|uniref:Uncharacterized protein n=1 Tax=Stentor coeruleus TaxID=5963 RepID=A0A1R2C8M9_9CILI|nr:hypothetical protein SteCoe_13336 [Stentor coeruleus]